MKKTKSTPRATPRRCAVSTGSEIASALRAILDAIDYTTGNCRPNEMVGAVLDKRIIENARAALSPNVSGEPPVCGEKL